MEFDTLFGKVVTREVATSLQRSHSVLLKDNMHLKPLFEWLRNLNIRSVEDVKSSKLAEMMKQIKFNRELKFEVDETVPMLVFRNIIPLQGDFQKGVSEYINLFYKAMYSPTDVML
ncbi:MAG: hypothetical protein K6T73_07390 [Candidatus Bathyarchaeota archaeon]|nr:hypothetical protein [Candidatus Bathyarchaeota archaeon]